MTRIQGLRTRRDDLHLRGIVVGYSTCWSTVVICQSTVEWSIAACTGELPISPVIPLAPARA
jgi:hypothetical protein